MTNGIVLADHLNLDDRIETRSVEMDNDVAYACIYKRETWTDNEILMEIVGNSSKSEEEPQKKRSKSLQFQFDKLNTF